MKGVHTQISSDYGAARLALRPTFSTARRSKQARCGYSTPKKVETDGQLLMANLTAVDISDSVGAQMIFDALRKRSPWIKCLFADGAKDRTQPVDKAPSLTSSPKLSSVSTASSASSCCLAAGSSSGAFGWSTGWCAITNSASTFPEAMIHVMDPCCCHRKPSAVKDRPLMQLSNEL